MIRLTPIGSWEMTLLYMLSDLCPLHLPLTSIHWLIIQIYLNSFYLDLFYSFYRAWLPSDVFHKFWAPFLTCWPSFFAASCPRNCLSLTLATFDHACALCYHGFPLLAWFSIWELYKRKIRTYLCGAWRKESQPMAQWNETSFCT